MHLNHLMFHRPYVLVIFSLSASTGHLVLLELGLPAIYLNVFLMWLARALNGGDWVRSKDDAGMRSGRYPKVIESDIWTVGVAGQNAKEACTSRVGTLPGSGPVPQHLPGCCLRWLLLAGCWLRLGWLNVAALLLLAAGCWQDSIGATLQ